jgi:hypothetical protein
MLFCRSCSHLRTAVQVHALDPCLFLPEGPGARREATSDTPDRSGRRVRNCRIWLVWNGQSHFLFLAAAGLSRTTFPRGLVGAFNESVLFSSIKALNEARNTRKLPRPIFVARRRPSSIHR